MRLQTRCALVTGFQTCVLPILVAAAARAIAAPPLLDLSFKDAADPLLAEIPGTSLLPGHLRRVDGGPVMELPGFDEGRGWVQDIAASLPARLNGRGHGRAIDL